MSQTVDASSLLAAAPTEIVERPKDHDDTIQEEMISAGRSVPNAQPGTPWPTPMEISAGTNDPSLMHKPISKKAMKRAAKAERLALLKLERRAREKQAKKEKKRVMAEKRAACELDEDDEEGRKRRSKRPKIEFGGKVIVDLGFDKMMNDKVS
jgi:tRNA (guanine9-N1)-methyltransferase